MARYITESEAFSRYNKILPWKVTALSPQSDFTRSDVWDDSEPGMRERALDHATRYINSFEYIGKKKDSEQDNKFPRDFQDEVPEPVKSATLELALFFLKHQIIADEAPINRQRMREFGVKTFWQEIGDTRERVEMSEQKETPLPILKHWLGGFLKGSYTIRSIR